MTFGHDFDTLTQYRAEKAAFDRLVTTCLTAPFDKQVFVCADESQAPMACLKRVHPEFFRDRDIDQVLRRDWQHEAF